MGRSEINLQFNLRGKKVCWLSYLIEFDLLAVVVTGDEGGAGVDYIMMGKSQDILCFLFLYTL